MLEIIHKLPFHSPEVTPYAADLVDFFMDLIRKENEDNAILCMKIIMDLERHQIEATRAKVQPFLDLILELFSGMEQVVKDTFNSDSQTSPASVPGTPGPANASTQGFPFRSTSPTSSVVSDFGVEQTVSVHLAKSTQSFKVIAECPIILVSILHAHRAVLNETIERVLPIIKTNLDLEANAQKTAHEEAAAKGQTFIGVSRNIKNRAAFGEFITAQIKTLSLMVHLIRQSNDPSKFLPQLPDVIVRLLKDCPAEKPVSRKELLAGLRNIIGLNHHQILLPKIDELLDERLLIGDGLTSYETRRPLAYALLSDLIHHCRESLNRDQMRKTVEVFTSTLHMEYPGTNLTTMSVGLLLNLAPYIRELPDKAEARFFLVTILDAIGDKFAAMNHEFNNATKISKQNRDKAFTITDPTKKDPNLFADFDGDPPDWDEIDIFTAQPVKKLHMRHRPIDPVKDNKLLFSFLVKKLKGFFFELKKCCTDNLGIDTNFLPPNWPEVSHGFNPEEVGVIRKLFREGSKLFRYYGVDKSEPEIKYSSPLDILASLQNMPIDKEEKDLLEGFGTIFHCIDPATFFEVFHTEIPYLHQLMLEHPALMHLPQFFLVCEATSSAFAGMMLQYLMDRIEEVGTDDVSKAKVLLRMFKLSFLAVGMFSEQNEHVLHPHITEIVTKCVQLSVTAKQPMNYFILLRCLFRSIGGSRFDILYKELLPLLEMLLETFNNLLLSARSPQERDFFVELTLTVPARLSHLLPHLSHLMRPIVVAVRGGTDLVGQGLRTLELCVDNLTADYLDPIMAPFMDEMMTALWEHLKPHPYPHFISHTSMRILGKLGGRNRKYLTHPPKLTFQEYADDAPSTDIRLIGSSKDKAFPLDLGVDLAVHQLTKVPKTPEDVASDTFYKLQAYHLLSSQLKLFIGPEHPLDDLATLVRLAADDLAAGNLSEELPDVLNTTSRDGSFIKLESEEKTVKKLLKACITATTVPSLASKAQPFLDDVCKHFVLVDIARTLALNRHVKRPFDVNGGDGPLLMDAKVLADAVVECLSSEKAEVRDAAKRVVRTVHETSAIAFGSPSKAGQISFFSSLSRAFCHACNAEEWFTKAGGTLGIRFLTLELNLAETWLPDKQAVYVRALMFVIKDTPPDLPASTRTCAEETLMAMIRKYTEGVTKEDLHNGKRISSLCSFLSCELSHQSRHVREVARKTLELIAEAVDCQVWELVLPVKDKLLKPIFNKPLRALPFPIQVGYIEAINYLLTLKHGVVPFGEHLTRLLMESLALVDAEDDMLAAQPAEFKTAQQIIAFRVSCLHLLSTAMSFPEFSSEPNNPARLRVLTVFFKFLHARAPEVIEAAKAGMRDYLVHTPKLPREVLQHGLRPILMNLQDAKRLGIPGLNGLARLLALLNNHFKVEIGSRLLDHTKIIADDRILQRASFQLLEQSREMKIIIAIFNVFHLLPPAASGYMKDIIDKVMQLEQRLRRTTWSPFREPTVKFLNRYAEESWSFFSSRFGDEGYGRFFGQILAYPESESIRAKLVSDSENFMKVGFPAEQTENRHTAMINAIYAVYSVCNCKSTRNWLATYPALKQALVNAGCELHARLQGDQPKLSERLRTVQAQDQLMNIFTIYLEDNLTDFDMLFEVVSRISTHELKATLAWSKFVYNSIITSSDHGFQKSLLRRCFDIYNSRTHALCTKTYILKMLVNPMILNDTQKTWGQDSKILDLDIVDTMNDLIWLKIPSEVMDEPNQLDLANVRMETLQLTATLLKYRHELIHDYRRDIIKYAWAYVRMEDIINKYSGYVLVSYFIVFYETPAQLVLQIFTSLLRAHNNESLALVLQALDVLGPSLPKRLPPAKPSALPWVRWPRRVLAEETNSNQVVCVFQFLVKHADMYYEKREDFAHLIINFLPKVATTAPNPNDTRKIALSLIGLLWSWEKRRHDELASLATLPDVRKRKAEEAGLDLEVGADGQLVPESSTSNVHEFQISADYRLILIRYLITFICSLTERYPVPSSRYSLATRSTPRPPPGSTMIEQAVQYLRNFLSPGHWTDLDVQLYAKAMDPILTSEKADQPDEKHTTSMINSLQVIRIILAYRTDEWILDNIQTIRTLLDKSLRLENPEIQDCLHAVEDDPETSPKLRPPVQRILDALPTGKREGEEPDPDASRPEFVVHLNSIVSEGLSNNHYTSSFNILWTLHRCRPEEVDQHMGGIMKAFMFKLAKDHVGAFAARTAPGVPPRNPEVPAVGEPEYEHTVDLISKGIDITSARIHLLQEHRRSYLNIIAGIAERSQDQRLCLKLLDLTEHWVFNHTETWPTSKEKALVLSKMLNFEHRSNPVPLKRFLELIVTIYEDPKVSKTDIAVRLEPAFLIGTRSKDVELRNRFMSLFDKSLSRSPNARLSYVLTSQNWDTLKDSFWISQASHLLLRAADMAAPARLHVEDYTVFSTSFLYGGFDKDSRKADIMVDSHLETLIADHRRFCHELGEVKSRDILEPLIQLQYLDPKTAFNIWITIFAISWSVLSQEERFEMEKGIVTLVTRPYHQIQIDDRPNVIQAIIEGCVKARPRCKIPPHVMKFLAKTFDVWYPTAIHLESSAISPIIDTPKARESNLDALVELYAGLQEDDLFYGTWRRRCKYVETNAALSHEQNGMWDKAQQLYEAAQIKARTGAVPFSQAEYYLWEDHWVLCAEKLQQWEILSDFAKHEHFNDLYLESMWRNIEAWSNDTTRESLDAVVKSVSDAPTPRRLYFQAFLTLLKCHANREPFSELTLVCDDAFQASIRKWHQLPKRITNAHVPILENFQLLVELHDATIISNSLVSTNERNLDSKSAELKLLLGTWRDRLPNVWDDINAWQDLVTWRQHIFQLINTTYLNLLPTSAGNVASNSYAYRGYHEIAWIVNRFAHVARKHQMPEVCINQLSRIYTLPNIEIQEAFLKLREQAKCHYQNPKELTTGLDVINNTNLSYFTSPQKAEFYTLKGMFLAKLGKTSETDDAFGVALYFDVRSARAWAEWAQFNDQSFKADPSNMELARNAMSCYLEAAGLYKSHKSRKILSRILWLLTLDDKEGTISKIFENFGGETPVWYWVTFIPQLLTGLTQKEAELCKAVLGRIAKLFPQSLFFSLRTSREEFLTAKKQHDQKMEKANKARSQAAAASHATPNSSSQAPTTDAKIGDQAANKPEARASETPTISVPGSVPTPALSAQNGTNPAGSNAASNSATPQVSAAQPHQHPTDPAKPKSSQPPRPWEYCEEVMAGLKTAFPLLALSMETMVDQIHSRFKCTIDEDAYRLIVALLNDGIACVSRAPVLYDRDGKLPSITEGNVKRFMENVLPANIRKAFEQDFDLKSLSMYEYIQKLRRWRDRFEEKLDSRASPQSLEAYSSNLAEFKFFKFDEVEVPGQYLQLKDNHKDFIRIDHYLPDVDLVRGPGGCHRRIKIRGHDGSLHPFAVQHPSPRHCRREERMLQLFRIFNSVLERKKESRRRNIKFYLPVVVPLASHIRLIQDDPSYISLQAIYEDHCRRVGMNKDDPILFTMEKMRALIEARQNVSNLPSPLSNRAVADSSKWTAQQSNILRTEIFAAIQEKWVPHTLVLEYFQRIYPNYADLYLFRRQVSYQYACVAFMTYVMHMNSRLPSKLFFSRSTGNIWASDILPSVHTGKGVFFNPEPVPFRLTPNLQTLMGPLFMEGIFSSTMMAIARCLTEPRHELEQQLSIFVRDELLLGVVPTMYLRSNTIEHQLREFVQTNTDFVVNRAVSLASSPDGTLPANQSVIDLISRAVNPHQLAQCDALWMAYI